MVFQLYEKNGVIKRGEIDTIVKLIPSEERKKLWKMGIKIGRYHVYLPKMLKPKAVEFRVSLWKIFYNLANRHEIPRAQTPVSCQFLHGFAHIEVVADLLNVAAAVGCS